MTIRVKIDKRVNQMEPLLRNVVWAISKGIGDDVRDYLANYHKTTNNASAILTPSLSAGICFATISIATLQRNIFGPIPAVAVMPVV